MSKDERLYAFIVSRTSRSRSSIRRFSVHKRWVKASALAAALVFCAAAYGVYGLTQQAVRARIEEENNREHIEDASRRLSEMSGTSHEEEGTSTHGAGGPALRLDDAGIANVEARAARLEENLRTCEAALRERVPSIWPVEGEMTDGFGVRGNPFGGGSAEFHPGQDIAAPRGTSVVAAADGTVVQAGWQNGYGQEVVVDHGHGLTTRYGHLSKIEVAAGQSIRRGEELGQVGSTGRSTGPHLHYEVRIDDMAVSPLHYLPAR